MIQGGAFDKGNVHVRLMDQLPMEDINSFGQIQLLPARNVGVVIRDESELNNIHIKAAKRKYKESTSDKAKGKGKENEAPSLGPNDNFISKAALAQRLRRERERKKVCVRETKELTSKQVAQRLRRERERTNTHPTQPRAFPGLVQSRRSRASTEREAKKAKLAHQTHLLSSPLTTIPHQGIASDLHNEFNGRHNEGDVTLNPLVSSFASDIQQQTPNEMDKCSGETTQIIEECMQRFSLSPIAESIPISPNSSSTPINDSPMNVDHTSTSANPRAHVTSSRHFLGSMNVVCPYCSALHWRDEKLVNSSFVHPLFGKCCLQEKIRLPLLIEPPEELKLLYDGIDGQSKSFRLHAREYNAANAFTSLGVQMDERVLAGTGLSCFTIHGELRHRTGALLPEEGQEGSYAQLYIYDSVAALDVRERRNPRLRKDVLQKIQECLLVNNAFTHKFREAFSILDRLNTREQNIPAYPHYNSLADRRRYNLPSADEIAVVVPGDGTEVSGMRDIIIRLKGNQELMRINECHPAYLPLHYVLLFPHGELGWEPEMKLWDVVNGREINKRLTQMQYYSYRLFQRDTEYSTILRAGKLFQEFVVDAWASTEQNRLNYYRMHQGNLRSELYQGFNDGCIEGFEPNEIGRRIVLPSSFTGSARHMFEIFQDSMAITRLNQHPDIFLTMTANPKWPEITSALLPNQKTTDRPDLVARVFELKRNALMKEIEHKKVFGDKVAHVFTIEFQKRGLPHMHTLLFLESASKIKTCDQVDRYVCAEFPDPVADPPLFETVKSCMVHGPCGVQNPKAPCMENGKCTKRYPRQFSEATTMDKDGYPVYHRRNDGRQYTIGDKIVDNRDVVPYNAYLPRMFNCHINVEVCAGLRCVKYINKYIYKGHDRTTMVVGGIDEIKQYPDARYIGPPEAVWRIFGYPLHEEFPSVVQLALHLPGMHHVVFNPGESKETIISRAANQMTSLTGFFAYCASNESARIFTYQEFPQYFVWNKTQRIWTPRKKKAMQLVECTLLALIQAACIARGLLEDDDEWVQCLQEAVVMKSGYQLRRLFSVILTQCVPLNPNLLWIKFAMHICDDLAHKLRMLFAIPNPTETQIEDYGLYLINQLLQELGKNLTDFPPMPQPVNNWSQVIGNRLIWEHRQLHNDAEQGDTQTNVDRLNDGQKSAYAAITSSVFEIKGIAFFFSGGAGTGKTFLYNTIGTKCRSLGHIVITVASSGIASLLLIGGRTAHSTFCIPLDVLENTVCGFTKQSIHAELFKTAKLIIWDEVSMQHRHWVEAVDRTLQDICDNKKPFGGITVVLGGDFRQILPVIPKGVFVSKL